MFRKNDAPATGNPHEDEVDPFSDRVNAILKGAIDMHCHSGPSLMPRSLDHIEAIQDASDNGFRAILIKDHFYSATPITRLLEKHYGHLGVMMFSGVALNITTGGLNLHAVDHGLALGAKIIWMPTFSAHNHIEHEKQSPQFSPTSKTLLHSAPLSVLGENGKLVDEVLPILDMIAEYDVILSGGHLNIAEILPLFEEAKKRGVTRLLCNHPSFIIDASDAQVTELADMGAFIEHSLCMFITAGRDQLLSDEKLVQLIEAGGIGQTILGSDLGQEGNMWPVRGFRSVVAKCIRLGYSDADIKAMICHNPARLLGLQQASPDVWTNDANTASTIPPY